MFLRTIERGKTEFLHFLVRSGASVSSRLEPSRVRVFLFPGAEVFSSPVTFRRWPHALKLTCETRLCRVLSNLRRKSISEGDRVFCTGTRRRRRRRCGVAVLFYVYAGRSAYKIGEANGGIGCLYWRRMKGILRAWTKMKLWRNIFSASWKIRSERGRIFSKRFSERKLKVETTLCFGDATMFLFTTWE